MKWWYKILLGEQVRENDYHPTVAKNSQIIKVRQMVQLACRYTPWQAKCLVESILIKKLTGKVYNLPLYLGIRKEGGRFLAHAWINENQANKLYKVVSVHI